MEEVVKEAQQHLGMYGKKTILFVDEIHRFNKGQQDYLLPFVEDGTLVLIGATTENPYFEVNGALLSRSIIFELKSLEKRISENFWTGLLQIRLRDWAVIMQKSVRRHWTFWLTLPVEMQGQR